MLPYNDRPIYAGSTLLLPLFPKWGLWGLLDRPAFAACATSLGVTLILAGGDAGRPQVLSGHPGSVRSVAFSPAGDILAAAGGIPGQGLILVWSLGADGSVAGLAQALLAAPNVVGALAWSPAGDKLAAGDEDAMLTVWERPTGGELRKLPSAQPAHSQAVRSLAWSPAGDRLVSTGLDNTINLWDSAPGAGAAPLQSLDALPEVDSDMVAALSPSGRYLAVFGVPDASLTIHTMNGSVTQGSPQVNVPAARDRNLAHASRPAPQ